MSKLFQFKDVRNKPSRNGFDLSNKMAFTAKVGELLPVYWKLTLPGDSFDLHTQHFTRTAPVQSAAFTRIREYFDWFFVPLRLLYRSAGTVLTQMSDNPVQASSMSDSVEVSEQMPYLMLSDLMGTTAKSGSDTLSVLQRLPKKDKFYFMKLISYLGYGQFNDSLLDDSNGSPVNTTHNPFYTDVPVNIFPLAAYQKIYQDYFRNSQWENATPFAYNFDYQQNGGRLSLPAQSDNDYWVNPNLFTLRYANWNKDLFMGLLPESQYGDPAMVEFSGSLAQQTLSHNHTLMKRTSPTASFAGGEAIQVNTVTAGWQPVVAMPGVLANPSDTNVVGIRLQSGVPNAYTTADGDNFRIDLSSQTSTKDLTIPSQEFESQLSVLQLRQAEALQRWKEVAQSGSQDYKEQIYKHFGVTLPDVMSDLCTFIGGDVSQLDINEVVNQAFTDSVDSLATIKGKGVGVGESWEKFTCKEHGIIMCIYHAVPLLDYATTGIDRALLKTSAYDYAIPEFDRIGYEELETICLTNGYDPEFDSVPITTAFLGYTPRYVDYKTSYDRVVGDFVQSEQMKTWVAPVTDSFLLARLGYASPDNDWQANNISYGFFKVSPSVLDPIFYANADHHVSTDQLMVNSFFDVKAVRNLDYNGLPY